MAPGWEAKGSISMTDQTDKTSSPPVEDVAAQSGSAAPAGISRRDVLRGATVAVPTILTLHSGTALAVASSTCRMSASNPPAQIGDNFIYLDTTGKVGPVYDISGAANAKAVPVFYEYVSTDDLLGVDLTKPNDISKAIKDKGIRPLKANQLRRSTPTNYVPVVYDRKHKKYDPLTRGGGTVVAAMPAAEGVSLAAATSCMAAGSLNTQFLI
jgi:hypothetical protein